MKIINIAKTTLGESDSFKNSVESYFIDCLKEKSYYNDKRDYFATSVLSQSINLNFDSEGRVTIPEKLLKHEHVTY